VALAAIRKRRKWRRQKIMKNGRGESWKRKGENNINMKMAACRRKRMKASIEKQRRKYRRNEESRRKGESYENGGESG
jgi:hypothetical protein